MISVDHYFEWLFIYSYRVIYLVFLRMPAKYYLSHTVLWRSGNNATCSRFPPTLTCVKHIFMFQLWRKGTNCKVFNNLFYYYEVTLSVKLFHL